MSSPSKFIFNGEPNKFNEFKRNLIDELHGQNLYDTIFGHTLPPIKPNIVTIKIPDKVVKLENEPDDVYQSRLEKYNDEIAQFYETSSKQQTIQYHYSKDCRDYYDRQGKAVGIILKLIGRSAHAQLSDELGHDHPSPKDIYKKLSNTYEKSSDFVNITTIYNKLNNMRYKESSDVVLFLQTIEDLLSNLTACGEILTENYKFSVLYNCFNHDDLSSSVQSEYKWVLNSCSMNKKSYIELKSFLISKSIELRNSKAPKKPYKSDKPSQDGKNPLIQQKLQLKVVRSILFMNKRQLRTSLALTAWPIVTSVTTNLSLSIFNLLKITSSTLSMVNPTLAM